MLLRCPRSGSWVRSGRADDTFTQGSGTWADAIAGLSSLVHNVGTTQRRARALIERILELNLWGSTQFFLLDVGCSGGIEEHWFAFGDRLRAIGFDPLIAEIDRLSSLNTDPGVVYEAAYVGCREYDRLFPPS